MVASLIDSVHVVLTKAHPSPASRMFAIVRRNAKESTSMISGA